MKIKLTVLSLSLLLTACANPYNKFYTSHLTPQSPLLEIISPSAVPEIIRVAPAQAASEVMKQQKEGYYLIGEANFNSQAVSDSLLNEQAKAVGASKVVAMNQYSHTEQGVRPLTLPHTTTAYHSGSVNSFGNYNGSYGNYGNYSGYSNYSGMTTVHSTQTTYIPYKDDYYNYGAYFLARLMNVGIGTYWEDLSTAETKKLGTNGGAKIALIIKNSPAFKADLLQDDIVLKVDGQKVNDSQHAISLIKDKAGKKVTLDLRRNGKLMKKSVAVPTL